MKLFYLVSQFKNTYFAPAINSKNSAMVIVLPFFRLLIQFTILKQTQFALIKIILVNFYK